MSSCCSLASIVSNEELAVNLTEVNQMLTLYIMNHFSLANVKIIFDWDFNSITTCLGVELFEYFYLEFVEYLGCEDLKSF